VEELVDPEHLERSFGRCTESTERIGSQSPLHEGAGLDEHIGRGVEHGAILGQRAECGGHTCMNAIVSVEQRQQRRRIDVGRNHGWGSVASSLR